MGLNGVVAKVTEADPTRARLLEAALELLLERGYRGATTRAIAQRAGVNEVTLFRHFGSKRALLREALDRLRPSLAPPSPGKSLEADLRALLEAYLRFLEEEGSLVLHLIPELLRHPELRSEGPPKAVAALLDRVVALFAHHQGAGRLWRREPPETLALSFVGPLMARFLLGQALGVGFPLEPESYVQGFLRGRGSP